MKERFTYAGTATGFMINDNGRPMLKKSIPCPREDVRRVVFILNNIKPKKLATVGSNLINQLVDRSKEAVVE